MLTRVRATLFSAFAAAILIAGTNTAFAAAPTSGLTQDGKEDLLKTAFLEALKKTLPGGQIIGNVSDFVIDPLVSASTTQGDTKSKTDAWLTVMAQSGLSLSWPPFGITLAGGKIVMGGTIYTVESMITATQDEQTQAILTGKGTGGLIDRVDNPAAETPFMSLPLVVNRGITPDNLGTMVKSERELRELWFQNYGGQLKDLYGRTNARLVLDQAWPGLLAMWKAQRAQEALKELTAKLDAAMREAQNKADAQTAAATSGTGETASAEGISGSWHMVCCSKKYEDNVTFHQNGSTLTGDFTVGSLKGSVNGNTVTFKRDWGSGKQDYTLTLNGNTMTGSFTGDRDLSVGVETTMTRQEN